MVVETYITHNVVLQFEQFACKSSSISCQSPKSAFISLLAKYLKDIGMSVEEAADDADTLHDSIAKSCRFR